MTSTSVVQVFEFSNTTVRTINQGGEPWFVLRDVCEVLEIGNPSDAARRLDDDEKGVDTIDTLGGEQQVTIINESGLYSLILTSRKPEAKRFKKWVTSEVLPQIRKTGSYALEAPQAKDPVLAAHIAALVELDKIKQNQEKIEREQLRITQETEQTKKRLDQIETAHDHFTIAGYFKYCLGRSVDIGISSKIGKRASRLCRKRGVQMGEIPDPRFGRVNSYPKSILDEIMLDF